MKTIRAGFLGCAFTIALFFPFQLVSADGDESKELKALRQQVEVLTNQVKRLEELVPTFTSFMPEFSERFHVMNRAGDFGDWALANHQAQEMMRMVRIAKLIDPEKGKLMEAFMGEPLKQIEKAVEHGSVESFRKAMTQAVSNCNTCHQAAGSPFIKVGLDIAQALSLRHSHILGKSQVSGMKHTH